MSGRLRRATEEAIYAAVVAMHPSMTGRAAFDRLSHELLRAGLAPPSYSTFMRRVAAIRSMMRAMAMMPSARRTAAAAGNSPVYPRAGNFRPTSLVQPSAPPHAAAMRGYVLAPALGTVSAVHHVPLDLMIVGPDGRRLGRPMLTITAVAPRESVGSIPLELAIEISIPSAV